MAEKDGGSAFPLVLEASIELLGDGTSRHMAINRDPGMSMRDYFAVRMMAALYSAPAPIKKAGKEIATGVEYADTAYELADALLEARSRTSGERT